MDSLVCEALSMLHFRLCVCVCLQEGAVRLISGELLEPSAASGEEGESGPRHFVRPLPQQHHPTVRADQRGLGAPLQEGDPTPALRHTQCIYEELK